MGFQRVGLLVPESKSSSSRRNSEKNCAQNLKQPHFIYKNQAKMSDLQMTSNLCKATKKKHKNNIKIQRIINCLENCF